MFKQGLSRLALAVAVLAFGACEDADVVGAAGTGAVHLEIVSGDGQQAPVGTTLSEALAVRATDASGDPVVGAAIAFEVVEGKGEFTATHSTTGTDGVARAHWTLGAVPGTQRAAARIEGRNPVDFTADASIRIASELANLPRMSLGASSDSVAVTASWEPVRTAVAYDWEAGTESWSWRASGRTDGTSLDLRAPQADESYWFCTVPVTARGTRLFTQINCDQAAIEELDRTVAELTLTPERASLQVGRTLRLDVAVLDRAGESINREIEWSSSRPAVASVNRAGVVTAREPGSTTITARADGISARAAITTVAPSAEPNPPADPPANPQELTLSVEAVSSSQVRLRGAWPAIAGASRYAWQAGSESEEWRDSGSTSATSLTITAPRDPGQYAFCVMPVNGSGNPVAEMACAVQGLEPNDPGDPDPAPPAIVSVEISPRNPSLRVGESVQLSATARTRGGSTIRNPEVTWTSSNSEVATVDRNGRLTARMAGVVTITAATVCCGVDANIAAQVAERDQSPGGNVPGLLFMDDFEGYPVGSELRSTGENGFVWTGGNGRGVYVSDDRAYSGTRSLRFRFGRNSAGDSHVWAEQRFRHPEVKEYWIEYYLYLPDNYTHEWQGGGTANNNKFHAAWGPDGYSGAGTGVLQTWTRADGSLNGNSTINWARYPPGGNSALYPRNWTGSGMMFVRGRDNGKWHRIRIHLKMADIGAHDGVTRVWRDDELVYSLVNDNNTASNTNPSLNWYTNGYLLGYDNAPYYREQTDFYIDDFRFYTSNPGW